MVKIIALIISLAVALLAQQPSPQVSEEEKQLVAQIQQLKSEIRWLKIENLSQKLFIGQQEIDKFQADRLTLMREVCDEAKIPYDKCNVNSQSRSVNRIADQPQK